MRPSSLGTMPSATMPPSAADKSSAKRVMRRTARSKASPSQTNTSRKGASWCTLPSRFDRRRRELSSELSMLDCTGRAEGWFLGLREPRSQAASAHGSGPVELSRVR